MPKLTLSARLVALGLLLGASIASASEVADASIVVDTSALPAITTAAGDANPYRGNPRAADIGRQTFNQACARCHGPDGDNKGQVGPDLLKLDRGCSRIADRTIREMCIVDNDQYFLKSVQYGKTRVGVVHMPAWQDVLSPAAIWTIRTFLESRSRPAAPAQSR
ncbi:c-type cytochrome [Zoogloea sp. LCSB751]|uniref:c-type cytochrome n=1 Tax=Zoogloea sp. LCSB751 TaxID=1965277 RepID=UPI0011175A45|nr:c-type cytochrome [Zoogloea sp. LCSB751]